MHGVGGAVSDRELTFQNLLPLPHTQVKAHALQTQISPAVALILLRRDSGPYPA